MSGLTGLVVALAAVGGAPDGVLLDFPRHGAALASR